MTSPRSRRTKLGMKTMAMAMAVSLMLAPRRAATVRARISGGNENMASIARMITESTAPRKKPAISPSGSGDHEGDADDLEGGPERDAAAPDQPAEDVPPQVVGAQPVRGRRPGVDDVEVLQIRRVRGDQRGEDGRHGDDQQEGQAGEGEGLVAGSGARSPSVARSADALLDRCSRGVGQPDERVAAGRREGEAHPRRIFGLR